jgi:hypothetical protein
MKKTLSLILFLWAAPYLDSMLHGAIDILPDDAGALFQASRPANPRTVLQLNHPRSGDLGYFNNFKLDPEAEAQGKK